MSLEITLRPASKSDLEFRERLFLHKVEEELGPGGLPREQMASLGRMQFNAQLMQYTAAYPEADFDLVLADGEMMGWFYVDRSQSTFTLIDILIQSEHRSQGIGTHLLNRLFDEAKAAGKSVDAHVMKQNRAKALWLRLGFRVIRDEGVYLALNWSSEQQGAE